MLYYALVMLKTLFMGFVYSLCHRILTLIYSLILLYFAATAAFDNYNFNKNASYAIAHAQIKTVTDATGVAMTKTLLVFETLKGERMELLHFLPAKISADLEQNKSVHLRYRRDDPRTIRFEGERERPEVPLIIAIPFLILTWRPRFIFSNSRNEAHRN